MLARLAPALALALLAPGCARDEPAFVPDDDWYFSGALVEDATEAQLGELRALVDEAQGDLLVLETFPLQFVAENLEPDACAELRALVERLDYVTSVSSCREPERTHE